MANTRWIRLGDAVPIAVCLLIAVTMLTVRLAAPMGGYVKVTTPTEEYRLPLDTDTELTVSGKDGLTVTICVKEEAVFVTEADCPDGVCVRTGKLLKSGQSAVCLPAQVTLTVEGGTQTVLDGIAR